ncbi:MAG: PEP-CTERM sorting domain-containing protein [Verrucomicrobiota bacterium]|nr:PEP-CTERM sorting domain-containing protein [Verrucomicrobiota bacterium]
MKKAQTLKLNVNTVQTHLGLCAAALAGTAAAVPSVQAAIITNTTIYNVPQTLAGIYLNFQTGVAGASAAASPGWDFNPYQISGTTQLGFYWPQTPTGTSGGVGSGTSYTDLTNGSTVSSASTFILTIAGTTPNFTTAGLHTLGFRFMNEATGIVNYGYLQIQTGANGFPAQIRGYRYENTGAAITVANLPIVVPEPSTTALLAVTALALGAVGVRKWRRQAVAA